MWNFLISRFIEEVNKKTISFFFFSTGTYRYNSLEFNFRIELTLNEME